MAGSAWQLVLLTAAAAASAQREQGPGKHRPEQKRNSFGGASSLPQQYGHGRWGGGRPYPPPQPFPGGGPPPFGPHVTSVHVQPEKLVLNCAVHGYSAQPVQWLKPSGPGLVAEGQLVLWDRRHFSVQQTALGSRLVLTYPQPRHLGTYLCRAGHATSAPFTVGAEPGGWRPLLRGAGRSGGGGSIRAEQSQPPVPAQGEGRTDVEAPDSGAGSTMDSEEKNELLETIVHEIEEVEKARSGRAF